MIILLLLIIALPMIINLLTLGWLFAVIVEYRYLILIIIIGIVSIKAYLIYLNRATILWNRFSKKTEKIIHKIIKREFSHNPTVTPRKVFDEVVKEWVPLANKLYPSHKPKDLGLRLSVTPDGIKTRMFNLGLISQEE